MVRIASKFDGVRGTANLRSRACRERALPPDLLNDLDQRLAALGLSADDIVFA